MVLFVAAALLASPPPSRPVTAAVQATATIRIVTAVRLTLGADNRDAPPARDCAIKLDDGSLRPAKLIEFQ